MLTIHFSQNWNGKLFLDTFGSVRLYNPDIYYVGNEFELFLRNTSLGNVRVVACRKFYYKQISDVLAYLDMGKPAQYAAEMVKRFYESKTPLTAETELHHVILQYTERHLLNHSLLLQDWWKDKQLQQPRPALKQTSLNF